MLSKNFEQTLSNRAHLLLKKALDSNQDFAKILTDGGLAYEDLRYMVNPTSQVTGSGYKILEDYKTPYHGVSVVSFFSGCGGLDLGFEAAGYNHLCLIENNKIFCDTIRKNREWTVIGPPDTDGDVSRKTNLANLLDNMGIKKNFPGVFVGGPPCQPFSIAANQRFSKNGENFKRVGFDHAVNGNLLFDYVWFIEKYLPAAFLIENVPGLIDLDGGKQIAKVYKSLSEKGYNIHSPLKINAAFYGIPQQRERVFIIGFRGTKTLNPPRPHPDIVPCIHALLNIKEDCPNHITRKHKASSIARYVQLNVGKRDQLGRVDRLDPNQPSKTVIAGGALGGGRSHLHPYIPRTLSVRECARLQTFPDDYFFTGAPARQFTQVGNAVPPVLGAQLAQSIYESYFKDTKLF